MNQHVLVLYQSLIDQETGQRGYSLSKNATFLEPFYEGSATFKQTSEKLKLNLYDSPILGYPKLLFNKLVPLYKKAQTKKHSYPLLLKR